jgi:hypothetical protein
MYTHSHLHSYRALSAGLLLAFAQVLTAQVGLGLSPMRLEMKLKPGLEQSGVLTLSSDSNDRVRVRAEALDFWIDQYQTPQFESSLQSETGFSCRDWVSVNPVETEVAPLKQVNIRYTVRVPANAESPRGYHCAIGFSTLPTDAQVGGNGIKTAVRVVSAFYVVVGNPPIEGQFKELRLVHSTEGDKPHWVGEVVVQNHCLTHFRPVGELSVLDSDGKVVESVALTPLPALPNREQRYLVPFTTDLALGTYTLRARVDFGTNVIEEGTAQVRTDQ